MPNNIWTAQLIPGTGLSEMQRIKCMVKDNSLVLINRTHNGDNTVISVYQDENTAIEVENIFDDDILLADAFFLALVNFSDNRL